VLASLNHPNIAAIYGVEETGGVKGLVMELVDGPRLADLIAGIVRRYAYARWFNAEHA
jgi:eukaryotic-like serine/threonine-protein kinase